MQEAVGYVCLCEEQSDDCEAYPPQVPEGGRASNPTDCVQLLHYLNHEIAHLHRTCGAPHTCHLPRELRGVRGRCQGVQVSAASLRSERRLATT
jgi:hypothetical protein